MKILYLSLNLLSERCGGSDNTKEQCSCISIVVSLKNEWLGKVTRKQR